MCISLTTSSVKANKANTEKAETHSISLKFRCQLHIFQLKCIFLQCWSFFKECKKNPPRSIVMEGPNRPVLSKLILKHGILKARVSDRIIRNISQITAGKYIKQLNQIKLTHLQYWVFITHKYLMIYIALHMNIPKP